MNAGITIQRLFAKQAANFGATLKEAQAIITAEHPDLDGYIDFLHVEFLMPTASAHFHSGDPYPNQLAVAEIQINERLDIMSAVADAIERAANNNEVLVATTYIDSETAELLHPLFGNARDATTFEVDFERVKPFLKYLYS
jgi:hypothetical protein